MSDALKLLVVTRGHAFDRSAFMAMFDDDRGLDAVAVDQPAAQILLRPEHVADYDAVLFYDMWGIALPGQPPIEPPADYAESVSALLEAGTGIVLLNHALISWPAWPLWRELSATSFLLSEAMLGGTLTPGSGFRGGAGQPDRNTSMTLRAELPGHPVLAGLEDGFTITDELYLKTPGFERDVVPLLRSDFTFEAEHFSPPPLAPEGERTNWTHPTGSDLVVWARATRSSPVVACELGDGPDAYGNPAFRRLVGNAVRWVASEEARRWAANA